MWCNFLQDGAKIKFPSWLSSILFSVDIFHVIKLLFLNGNISIWSGGVKWRAICLVSVITIMDN
ncbi:hypothetical protein CWO03_16725 [Vibrio splendidus]|nr:hypothetical protein CWO03_16725 [Vibrio splendidus]